MTRTLTGRGVLMWFLGFFGLIFVTNAYFITVAIQTFRGEDEQRPYLQGAAYNDTLSQRAWQRQLGWTASIAAARDEAGTVRVTIALFDAAEIPQSGVVLRGDLRHPADENRDRRLVFHPSGAGLYQAEVPDVGRGYWDVKVSTVAQDQPFEAVRRVWLP